jgi:hypothetical protein
LRHRCVWLAAVVVCASAGAAPAALLTGSVSFDAHTGLYTYSYTLDNRHGPGVITQLDVEFESLRFEDFQQPLGHSTAPGWEFRTEVSGGIANPPYAEVGSFWAWYNASGVPVGATLSGFSFTTRAGPTAGTGNNYFVFANDQGSVPPDFGIVAYGHVVAPDLTLAPAPEPTAFALAALGSLGVAAAAGRHRRVGQAKTGRSRRSTGPRLPLAPAG